MGSTITNLYTKNFTRYLAALMANLDDENARVLLTQTCGKNPAGVTLRIVTPPSIESSCAMASASTSTPCSRYC